MKKIMASRKRFLPLAQITIFGLIMKYFNSLANEEGGRRSSVINPRPI